MAEIINHICAEQGSPASMHDFRAVFGITHSNLIFDVAITDEFPMTDKELCERIDEVITVDRDYTSNRFGHKV